MKPANALVVGSFLSIGLVAFDALAQTPSSTTADPAAQPPPGYGPPAYGQPAYGPPPPNEAGYGPEPIGSVVEDPSVHFHDRFYLRMAIGLSYTIDKAEFGAFESTIQGPGLSSAILFGGTPAPGLVVGGGYMGATALKPKIKSGAVETTSDSNLNLSSLGAFVDYYTNPHEGFHLLGFVGFGFAYLERDNRTSSDNPRGLTFAVGGGYEWWVGEQWGIGVMGQLQYAHLKYEDLLTEKIVVPSILFTATYH